MHLRIGIKAVGPLCRGELHTEHNTVITGSLFYLQSAFIPPSLSQACRENSSLLSQPPAKSALRPRHRLQPASLLYHNVDLQLTSLPLPRSLHYLRYYQPDSPLRLDTEFLVRRFHGCWITTLFDPAW